MLRWPFLTATYIRIGRSRRRGRGREQCDKALRERRVSQYRDTQRGMAICAQDMISPASTPKAVKPRMRFPWDGTLALRQIAALWNKSGRIGNRCTRLPIGLHKRSVSK
jgi:hypothetical protein